MSGAQHASLGATNNASSSSRNRKRRTQASRAQRSAAQAQQQAGLGGGPQQHSNIQQGFVGGPRGGFAGNQMPPPGMHPGHGPPLTGMGLGSVPPEDDLANFILDDLDKLTDRDLAIARYKRHHELLNLIFDARRIDSLEPSPSPYAEKDQTALKEQHTALVNEVVAMREAHTDKFRRWRDEVNEQDAILHAPPKRLRMQRAEREKLQDGGAGQPEQNDAADDAPAWASKPSSGEIVGVGFVRAKTPEAVRELLPRPPEPEPAAAPPAASTSANNVLQATPGATLGGLGAPAMPAPAGQAAAPVVAVLPQNDAAASLPAQATDAVSTRTTIADASEPTVNMDVDERLDGEDDVGDDEEDDEGDDDEDDEDDDGEDDEGGEEDDGDTDGDDDEDADDDDDEDDGHEDGDDEEQEEVLQQSGAIHASGPEQIGVAATEDAVLAMPELANAEASMSTSQDPPLPSTVDALALPPPSAAAATIAPIVDVEQKIATPAEQQTDVPAERNTQPSGDLPPAEPGTNMDVDEPGPGEQETGGVTDAGQAAAPPVERHD